MLLEVIARIFLDIPLLDYENPTVLLPDNPRVFGLKPSFEGRFTGVDVNINSFGFRDEELNVKKPGEFRIMGLGDSVLFGYKVKQNYDTLSVLENKLKEDNISISIVNTSVPAYAFPHEVETYNYFKNSVKPDLVIVGFVLNDVKRVDPIELTKNSMAESLVEKAFWKKVIAYVRGNSKLWALVEDRLPNILFSIGYSKPFPIDKTGDIDEDSLAIVHDQIEANGIYLEKYEQAWKNLDNQIGEFKKTTDSDGIPVVFVIFPWREQISKECWRAYNSHLLWKNVPLTDYALSGIPQKYLVQILEKHDIKYVDLLESFRKNSGETCQLMIDRNHPTPQGHRIAAETLERFLITNGYVK